jgi:type II secretion system protein G
MSFERKAFTIVEILIVVVILGIVAAIVVPQFSEESDDARLSAMTTDLSTVRSQLQMYRIHHNDKFPANIVEEMTKSTKSTKADRSVMPEGGNRSQYPYGPYLLEFPTNPFVEGAAGSQVDTTSLGGGDKGWYYNSTTGQFAPDDDAHKNL